MQTRTKKAEKIQKIRSLRSSQINFFCSNPEIAINICTFGGGIYIEVKSKVYGRFLFDFTRSKMVEL